MADLVVGALRVIRNGDAEIVRICAVLREKVTHDVSEPMMAGGK